MALKRILSYRKLLVIDTEDNYGTIFFKYQGGRKVVRKDLELEEFLCLSHMLENDIVFYDTKDKYFASQVEPFIPKNVTPRA